MKRLPREEDEKHYSRIFDSDLVVQGGVMHCRPFGVNQQKAAFIARVNRRIKQDWSNS